MTNLLNKNYFYRIVNVKNGNLQNSNVSSLSSFMSVCKEALDIVAPSKQKYIRGNNGPFKEKDITKTIMKRTRPMNNGLKNRCDANKRASNNQINPCVSLVWKAKLIINLTIRRCLIIRHFRKL